MIMKKNHETLEIALRAICLTRDYVGEETLPAIKGWEWFDAGNKIAKIIPDSFWTKQFYIRCKEIKYEQQPLETTR